MTVVNQPYLLGWQGDRLLVQTYEPLEDDKRDWSDVPKALRQKAKKPKTPLWKKIAEHDESIDWEQVRAAAAEPRGIAFSVGPGPGRDLAATIAQAPTRQERHPDRRDLERRRRSVRRRPAVREAGRRRRQQGEHRSLS